MLELGSSPLASPCLSCAGAAFRADAPRGPCAAAVGTTEAGDPRARHPGGLRGVHSREVRFAVGACG
jgi:hypothetical protein